MTFNYQCNHCNKKIKINIFFDKLTSNYITVDTPQYRKFIRKEKLKKLK